jgi:hypothetical protein
MEEAAFLALWQAIQRDPGEWTLIARSSLAVKYEWSTMDIIFSAEALAPIATWAGAAALQVAATPGGGVVRMPGSAAIEHLCIPNLSADFPTIFVEGTPALRAHRESVPTPARTGEFDRLLRRIMERTGAIVELPDPTVRH